jgi:hypothetical protein
MTSSEKTRVRKQPANDYAKIEDFCRAFAEGMNELYYLSFLLTADPHKAEQCFVAGLEDSLSSNRVFKEWARSWAKRTIIQNAIRVVVPRAPGGTLGANSDHSWKQDYSSCGEDLDG